MRRTLSIAVAVATLAVIPGVSAAETPETVRWGPCPAEVTEPGLKCSTLQVPLDYRQPDGRQIEITISRLASTNPEKRRGVLFTNPGGPGGGGLSWAGQLGQMVPASVREAYDVIGIDPRGVGHSTPVNCDLTEEQIAQGNLPYANGPADVAKQAKTAKAVATQCATSDTGWLLPHITTANVARDLDRVRAALGESKISYHGASYGTYLGAVYTNLFPANTDRIVLDSNLGPGGYDQKAMRLLGRGLEDRFPDFAKFAAAKPEYGLGSTPEQVTAKFFELATRLDREPVGGIDGSLFRGMNFGSLYSDFGMTELAENWRRLDQGKPVPLPATPPSFENQLAARLYTICGDSSWSKSVPSYQVDVEIDRARYPLIGAGSANIGPCAYWPEPVEPRVRVTDRGPSNVLMVQNQRDPGTPLAGARDLRRAFGDRARMVTIDVGGHGSYIFAKNKCGDDAVTTFLITGQRPAQDLACAAEPR